MRNRPPIWERKRKHQKDHKKSETVCACCAKKQPSCARICLTSTLRQLQKRKLHREQQEPTCSLSKYLYSILHTRTRWELHSTTTHRDCFSYRKLPVIISNPQLNQGFKWVKGHNLSFFNVFLYVRGWLWSPHFCWFSEEKSAGNE